MSEKSVGNVLVAVTAEDKQLIADIMEGSPFPKEVLLKLALRIGLKGIQSDPTILMPYLAKKDGP